MTLISFARTVLNKTLRRDETQSFSGNELISGKIQEEITLHYTSRVQYNDDEFLTVDGSFFYSLEKMLSRFGKSTYD